MITLPRVVTDNTGSHLDMTGEKVPASAGTDLPVAALNACAKQKDSPLPSGTKANSVTVSGDTATVDFNEAFQKNFTGGDENEALAINAVLNICAQIPGVKQVQFTVAGKKIDSLGGTQSMKSPLPVGPPEVQQTASSDH